MRLLEVEDSLEAWIARESDLAIETERAKICLHYNKTALMVEGRDPMRDGRG